MISLFSQPWLITDESFAAMCKIAEQFDLQSLMSKPDGARAAIPLFEDQYDDDQGYLKVENGIGIVAIDGPIVKDPNLFDRLFFGASDMDAISAALEEAGERPDVKGVLLDINSPGGTVIGTPELANAVRQLARDKYVYAFTDGMMASAAYWIGSQADAIYATPSSRVGSVGVLQTVTNRTDQLKMRGVTVETFSAGKYKSAGVAARASDRRAAGDDPGERGRNPRRLQSGGARSRAADPAGGDGRPGFHRQERGGEWNGHRPGSEPKAGDREAHGAGARLTRRVQA